MRSRPERRYEPPNRLDEWEDIVLEFRRTQGTADADLYCAAGVDDAVLRSHAEAAGMVAGRGRRRVRVGMAVEMDHAQRGAKVRPAGGVTPLIANEEVPPAREISHMPRP